MCIVSFLYARKKNLSYGAEASAWVRFPIIVFIKAFLERVRMEINNLIRISENRKLMHVSLKKHSNRVKKTGIFYVWRCFFS